MAGEGGGRRDGIPQWVADEVRTARFGRPVAIKRAGYILETYGADGKADAQLYDPVEDGRHIVTMDLAPGVRADSLERGVAYEFSIDSFKAPLSAEASGYLREKMGIEMGAVWRFVMRDAERLDSGGQ